MQDAKKPRKALTRYAADGGDRPPVELGPVGEPEGVFRVRGDDRYEPSGTLGEGGMGEVVLVRDRWIGRHVAVKRLRAEYRRREDLQRRFLREATIQGQLEHPAIVPVYDLAMDGRGDAFFTMRRVQGQTLDAILEALRSGDPQATEAYPRNRLLTTFVTVCQAMEFAHERGVWHRDLKPANIMLGAFGEVYVLDWGIAKCVKSQDSAPLVDGGVYVMNDEELLGTLDGTVMGTAGYMAPEQFRPDLGPPSHLVDIYALGAILYELLSGIPLHDSALGDTEPMPAVGMREGATQGLGERVSPELEDLWICATKLEPQDRLASVRALREGVERYLAGDRDTEKRRELGEAHAKAAADAVKGAHLPGATGIEARKKALREVASALSFDPSNTMAAGTLVQLMTQPPAQMPEDLAELRQRRLDADVRTQLREVAGLSLGSILLIPMAWRAGILDAPVFYGNVFAWCFSGGVAYLVSRRKAAVGMWFLLPILYIYASVAACLSIMGVFAPFLMTISMTALAVHFQCTEDSFRHRLIAAGLGVGAVLGLFACQYLGLWCAPVRLTGEEIRVDATVLRFDSRWSLLVLGLATFQQFVVFVWRDWQLHVRVTKAEEAFELRHWQLRHLVPSAKVIPVIAQNMPGTSVETAPNLLPTNGEGARGSSPGRQGGS